MRAVKIGAAGGRWSWLAVVVALNVAAVALVVIGLLQLHARTLREAEVRSQNIALAIDLHLSNVIARVDLSLQTMATELDRHLQDGESEREQLVGALIRQHKAALPEAEAWLVVGAQGNILFHEGEQGFPSFSVADRDYFRDLESGRVTGLAIGGPLKSRLTGNWVLLLARAIRDVDGRLKGIVVVPLPIASFGRMLSGFELASRDVVTLRDADLRLISRFPQQPGGKAGAVGDANASTALRSLVASGKKQATYSASAPFDRVERIFSYRRLSNAPMVVVVGIAQDDFLEQWRHSAWHFSAVFALLLVACNTTAVLFYRQWRRQRQSAAALSDGNALLEKSLQQLRERDDALNAAQEAGQLGTYTLCIATGELVCSPNIDAIFGIDAAFLHTIEGWLQLVHPDDRLWMRDHFYHEVLDQHRAFDREYRAVRPVDGQVVWVHGTGRLDFDADGRPIRLRGTVQNVSARRIADERLQLAEEVFLNATEGLLITDRTGRIIEINPAFTAITGYTADEIRGKNPRVLSSGAHAAEFYASFWRELETTGRWDGEFTNRRQDGSTYIQYSRVFSIRDMYGSIVRFAAVISDVTAIKASQRRLEYLAYYDELTGLPNRIRLASQMRQAMDRCRRHGDRLLGVCCLDLDGFREINERWGQEAGDRLLGKVAQRLSWCAGAGDVVARLGGDEFVVVFCDLKDEGDAHDAASRLLETSMAPYTLEQARLQITFSVGVSLYPIAGVDEPDVLLRQADQAMYDAKRRGKNRICFFDVASERRLRERQTCYDRLVEALAGGEFRLHYQPKVSLRSGEVVGVEALLRWQHPERGLLSPQEFLPLIEGTELTLPLGEWILREAMQQLRRWWSQGLEIGVGVNIFGCHLQRADFVERLADLLHSCPEIDPATLDLEVVETTALENLEEVTARIRGCMALGVSFSLDDFGTGYSSLTYLRQLPVDHVKIDRSFVRDMLGNPGDRSFVESIVNMAHTAGRQVVAEGVETIAHGALLIRLGCDYAQGYGIARPMPPEDLPRWVAHWTAPDLWAAAIAEEVAL